MAGGVARGLTRLDFAAFTDSVGGMKHNATLASVLALFIVAPLTVSAAASAQTPPKASTPAAGLTGAAISAWLTAQGADAGEVQIDGERRFIRVETDGLPWLLFLQSCENDLCSDLQFSAGVVDAQITLDKVNGWNRDRRFVKGIFEAGEAGQPASAIAQYDVLVTRGGPEQLADALAIWRGLLPEFVRPVTVGAAATAPTRP